MDIHINWIALGRVAALSAVIAVAIVVVFAVGVLGVARMDTAGELGRGDNSGRTSGFLLAATAHGLCIAAVLYGLYLLIPQFH